MPHSNLTYLYVSPFVITYHCSYIYIMFISLWRNYSHSCAACSFRIGIDPSQHSRHISTSGAWHLQNHKTMDSIGAGNLTHFYLQLYIQVFRYVISFNIPPIHSQGFVDAGTYNAAESSGSCSKCSIVPTAQMTDLSNSE